MRSTGLLIAVLAATMALAAPPAGAQAVDGTIVYLQDGQIWMTTPDGSQQHQVTTSGEWIAPSMASDGTIVAVRREGHPTADLIVRMNARGEVLSSFQPDTVFLSGIYQAEVTPDGQYVVYNTIEPCSERLDQCTYAGIVWADGRSTAPLGWAVDQFNPTWYPDGSAVVTTNREPHWFGIGDESAREWFFEFGGGIGDASIAANGSVMSIVGGSVGAFLHFYPLNGPPPAEPDLDGCSISPDAEGSQSFSFASMSPDGTGVAYTLLDEGERYDQGDLWVLQGFDAETCSFTADYAEGLVVPGVTEPYWSAAPFDPTGEPGPGPGPTDPPTDGARIDGGGATDPVGQAIELSKALFPDGTADRVVLATSERFPDALAGSALAGEAGPILVTPFADTLDPRVEAEISRVTGGHGTALILGGVAAVTEGTATQARTAAGTTTCTTPFPTDCRYAGTGREHTATLIADTVLAEHATTRALLARGDEFADAITGGAYAAEAGVAILLTPSDQLNTHTHDWLQAHPQVDEVVVLGGTVAVDDATMAAVPVTDKRRVFGPERTATAARIALELWGAEGHGDGGIVLVNVRHADGWQTALSGAVASAIRNAPQLGVENPPAAPTQETLDAAAALGGPVLTLGDQTLVSQEQASAVAAAE